MTEAGEFLDVCLIISARIALTGRISSSVEGELPGKGGLRK